MASMTNKKKTSFKRTEKYQRTGYKFIAPGLLMMVLLIIYLSDVIRGILKFL